MTVHSITLTRPQLRLISLHGEKVYPNEACGLIAGHFIKPDTYKVSRVIQAENVLADSLENEFEVDPKTRIKLEKEIRTTGELLIGHYHSHPDAAAIPSEKDLARAFEKNLIDGATQETTAHMVLGDKSGFRQINFSTS